MADIVRAEEEEGAWTSMAPPVSPSARFAHSMAYDSNSDRIVLFGGGTNETWTYDYDSNTWTNMHPAASPAVLTQHAMAYDAQSDRVILFGGYDATGTRKDETWAYALETNIWTDMNPVGNPHPRDEHAMAYDAQSDRIILFGGYDNRSLEWSNETWVYDFDSNTWMNMSPTVRPSARLKPTMAYDDAADRTLLFGGYTEAGYSDETWAYDYETNLWAKMNPVIKPPARSRSALAYDAQSNRTILFGGATQSAPFLLGDTWVYDLGANTWERMELTPGPSPRWDHALVYDVRSDRAILFGGSTLMEASLETWAFSLSLAEGPTSDDRALPWALYAIVSTLTVGVASGLLWRYRYRHQLPPKG